MSTIIYDNHDYRIDSKSLEGYYQAALGFVEQITGERCRELPRACDDYDETSCPIALALRKITGVWEVWKVEDTAATWVSDSDDKPDISYPVSSEVKCFIYAFDDGYYPELVYDPEAE
jgi:hypothetical protein